MRLFSVLVSLILVCIGSINGEIEIANFRKTIVWKDLADPVAIRFASTGKVYIALKGGKVFVINSIYEHVQQSTDYRVLVDMSEEVFDWWDRGLSGIALHPNFPVTPYIYLWYSSDVTRNNTTPIYNDACPSRLCSTLGRLTRLTTDATGTFLSKKNIQHEPGTELLAKELLLEIACSYSPSHHTGNALFGPDGDMYLTIGDGSLIDGRVQCPCN